MNALPVDVIADRRLSLEPLIVDMADEMVHVLGDEELYRIIGGEPPTLERLRRQYAAQVVGRSADGSQQWLNWVIQLRSTGALVGYVQATIEGQQADLVAEVAWVVGVAHQRQGIATDAAAAVVEWLRSQGVRLVTAHIHPEHEASNTIARRVGLLPTETVVDDEIRWEGQP